MDLQQAKHQMSHSEQRQREYEVYGCPVGEQRRDNLPCEDEQTLVCRTLTYKKRGRLLWTDKVNVEYFQESQNCNVGKK